MFTASQSPLIETKLSITCGKAQRKRLLLAVFDCGIKLQL